MGGESNLSERRATDADEKVLGDAEMGAGNDLVMEGLVEVVSDELLGINAEQNRKNERKW